MRPMWGRWVAIAAGAISLFPGFAQAQAKNQATCYTSFDPDYLYVAVVVDKPALRGNQAAPFSNPLVDDAVAVSVQVERSPTDTRRTKRSVTMAVSAAGGAQLYRGEASTPLANFGDFLKGADGVPIAFKYGATTKTEINKAAGAGTGYTVEMAIPWIELGGPPSTGARLAFNIVSYSAAAGSPAVLSMSSAVKTAADLQNPSLWGELALVDAAVKTVDGAPNAKVAPRVFAAKPSIDGQVTDGEWSTLTRFAFADGDSGSIRVAVESSAARSRIEAPLKPASPSIAKASVKLTSLPNRAPQSVKFRVMALYHYNFQADPRRPFPTSHSKPGRGFTGATHPFDGSGPWMGYDRIDWHRGQLEQMRSAGIDTALAMVRDNPTSRESYALDGLEAMSRAARALHAVGKQAPQIAPAIDIESFGTGAVSAERLFSALASCFDRLPSTYRATEQLSSAHGRRAHLTLLWSSSPATPAPTPAVLSDVRKRFAERYGADLLFLCGKGMSSIAGFDGAVGAGDNKNSGEAAQTVKPWIKIAEVAAPIQPTRKLESGTHAPPLTRYQAAWKQAISSKSPWIVIESWNDFDRGQAIAPTEEFGLSQADLTRLMVMQAASEQSATAAACDAENLPRQVMVNSVVAIHLLLRNAGKSLWSPETHHLEVKWSGKPDPAIIPLSGVIPSGQSGWLNFDLPVNTAAGDSTITVSVAPSRRDAKSGDPSVALTRSLTVLSDPAKGAVYALSMASSDLPAVLESGGMYQVRATLRNDGAKPWQAGGKDRLSLRLWRRISKPDGSREEEPVSLADCSVPLQVTVEPGKEVNASVRFVLAAPGGAEVPLTSYDAGVEYFARWEIASGEAGAVADEEPVRIVENDFGSQIILDRTPPQLPAEKRLPVPIGLRNLGPQTWKKEGVRVGYHWYSLEGAEIVWDDETTPIPNDVEPGGETGEFLAWVTAPPVDGSYWLVWDVKVGDTWVSTQSSARSFDSLARRLEVIGGKLHFVNLEKAFTLDGVSPANATSDGNMDGNGLTLPDEFVPPLATTSITPVGLWTSSVTGAENGKRISFRWGPKGAGEKNMIVPAGQKVLLDLPKKADPIKTIHIIAAATAPDSRLALALQFEDGSLQYTSHVVSAWSGDAQHGEAVVLRAPSTHTHDGAFAGKPANLYRYSMRVSEKSRLLSIQLPNAPNVRILAITLER